MATVLHPDHACIARDARGWLREPQVEVFRA